MSPYDPEDIDLERPDGWHRVRVTYARGGVEMANEVENDAGEVNPPRPFDLTNAEEESLCERFFTRLAEDAADRHAEERGEKWG